MSEGLLITIDGPPGSGKTTQRKLLVERLEAMAHRNVVSMEDLTPSDERTLRDMEESTRNTFILCENDELMMNLVRAHKYASEGKVVVLERHICTVSSVLWRRERDRAGICHSYPGYLDRRFNSPDSAIVLRVRAAQLRRRLMRRSRMMQLRLGEQELSYALEDLREYVRDFGPGNVDGYVFELSGEHGESQIARRITKHLCESFSRLLPDEPA